MAQYDISIDQHRTWSFYAILKESGVAQDLSGYNFVLTVKKNANIKKPVLQRVLFTGSVPDGVPGGFPTPIGGSTSGAVGSIYLTLNNEETGNLPSGEHLYDIYMTKPNGEVHTLLSGKCYIHKVIGE